MDARPGAGFAVNQAGMANPLTTAGQRAAATWWAETTGLHLAARVVGVVDEVWPDAYRAGADRAHHTAAARVAADTTAAQARTGDADDPTGAIRAALVALGDLARQEQAQPAPVDSAPAADATTFAFALDAARRAAPGGDDAAYAAAVEVAEAAAHRAGAGPHSVRLGVRLLETWQNDIHPTLPPTARIDQIPADRWATRTIQDGIRAGLRVEPARSTASLARASFTDQRPVSTAGSATSRAPATAVQPAASQAAGRRRGQ